MNDRAVDASLTLALVGSLLMLVWVTGAFWQMPATTSVATLLGVVRATGVVLV